jgi:dTDP-4-amino-4,6-dideoxygalactose transaminase
LKHLDEWNEKRRESARLYDQLLKESEAVCPIEKDYAKHIYYLYVIRSRKRDRLQTFLEKKGIATLIHYPIPIHLQKAYEDSGIKRGALPTTEKIAEEILSLPIYPELKKDQVEEVAGSIKEFFNRQRT